jgi:hypothetical protein
MAGKTTKTTATATTTDTENKDRELEGVNPTPTAENPAPEDTKTNAPDTTADDAPDTADDDTTADDAETPVKAAKDNEGRRFVYVGPSLPGGGLKGNTILRGTRAEVEDYLAESLELFPQAAKLIVPVAKLAETKAKLQKSDNIVRKHFDDLSTAIIKRSREE